MIKNTSNQRVYFRAVDSATGTYKTGDAANLTAYVSKDYGSLTALTDTSATELSSTNAPGVYWFDVSQSETNADHLLFTCTSSTSGVALIPDAGANGPTVPPNFAAASIDSSGRVDVAKVAGTTQTARDLGASVLLSSGTGAGQLDFTSGVVKGNVTQFGGSAGTFAAGRPEVNATHIAGTAWASTTLFTLASHDPGATLGTSTLTQSQVTGGAYSIQSSSCVLGDARVANLDAAVSSRMATYTQPTGFLATTFPGGTLSNTIFVTAASSSIVASVNAEAARVEHGRYYVCFVGPLGSDSNDGLTPTTAKLTLAAAKAAAVAGTLIVVAPGVYNERNLLKTDVDWYFERGAVVNYTGSANGGLWDDSAAGAAGAVVCGIFGKGRFVHATTGAGNTAALVVSNASSRIRIECESLRCMSTGGSNNAGIFHTAGDLSVLVYEDITSDYYDGCILYGGSSAVCHIEADRIIGVGDDGIESQSAAVTTVRARLIQGISAAVNSGVNAGTQRLTIVAEHIDGPVFLDGAEGDLLTVEAKSIRGSVYLVGGGSMRVVGPAITPGTSPAPGVLVAAGTFHLCNASVRAALPYADLEHTGGTLSVSNCDYRPTRTSGTITVIEQSLTAAYDAAKTAASASALAIATAYVDTEVAAIKAVTDKLNTSIELDGSVYRFTANALEQISIGGLGTGARTVTVTVNDGVTALESARVRVTKGAESYVGSTGVSGVVAFALDDGTWTVSITLPGYTFATTALAVSAATSQTYSVTAITITPSPPDLVTGYGVAYDGDGEPEENVMIQLTLIEAPHGYGNAFDSADRTTLTDPDGLYEFVGVIPGGRYKLRRGNKSSIAFTVPADADDPYPLDNVMGSP